MEELIQGYLYICKDKRVRYVYRNDEGKLTSVSYPRLIMEKYLGRKLEPYEDVHHIDEDPLNNDISNLEIRIHGDHQKEHRKKQITIYEDKIANCFYCGKEFVWSAKAQKNFYAALRRKKNKGKERHVFCCKSCCGKYGREVQMANKVS